MLAQWILASSALLLAPQPVTLHGAQIVIYGTEPSAGSGIVMFLRSVEVAMPDRSRRTLYFVHADKGAFFGRSKAEPYPSIGAMCDFSIVTRHLPIERQTGDGPDGPDGPIGDMIEDARCNPASPPG